MDSEITLTFLQVIAIDVLLAGDNAIVVGLVAASLPAAQRNRVILFGIIAATILRIFFALFTSHLMKIVGLMAAGGLLLLWVSWKMWRELRRTRQQQIAEMAAAEQAVAAITGEQQAATPAPAAPETNAITMRAAIWQIVLADISMSLDNMLAVAGAARDHPTVIIFGLVLSVALMGAAAVFIARLLQRHHWIAYFGLAVILYVALDMVYHGALEVAHHF